jgi:hypothetical protein
MATQALLLACPFITAAEAEAAVGVMVYMVVKVDLAGVEKGGAEMV